MSGIKPFDLLYLRFFLYFTLLFLYTDFMTEISPDPSIKKTNKLDPALPIESTLPKDKKSWKTIFVAIAVIALLAGFFFYIFKIKSNNNLIVEPSATPVASQVPDIIDEDVIDWQTYTNSKAGYSIDYPNTWTKRESSDGLGAAFQPEGLSDGESNFFILISVMKKTLSEDLNQTFEEYAKTAGPQEIQNFQSLSSIKKLTTKFGIIGYTVIWDVASIRGNEVNQSLPFTYFEKPDDKTVTIQVVLEDENYLDIYDQMISTFQLSDKIETLSDPNLNTYKSPKLGVSFNYLAKTGNQEIFVTEEQNKICVSYEKNDVGCKIGQFVEVFEKKENESLINTIKTMFLQGKDPVKCFVITTDTKNDPQTFLKAEISYPRGEDDGMQEMQESSSYCSAEYSQTNGIRYFLADQSHPDKFVFFSIGQYYIPANDQKNWQDTIKFE